MLKKIYRSFSNLDENILEGLSVNWKNTNSQLVIGFQGEAGSVGWWVLDDVRKTLVHQNTFSLATLFQLLVGWQ